MKLFLFILLFYTIIFSSSTSQDQDSLESLDFESNCNTISDRKENLSFYEALRESRTDLVERYLSEGFNPNDPIDESSELPIFFVIKHGLFDVVDPLLRHGVNVNVTNQHGFTPLCLSLSLKFEHFSSALLRAYADPEYLCAHEVSPLMIASQYGLKSAVKEILSYNVDVNHATPLGNTALCFASTSGHIEVVNILLDVGADVFVMNSMSATPLMLAVSRNHTNVAKVLIDRILSLDGDINATDRYGRTAFDIAFDKGYSEIMKMLSHAGARVGRRNIQR